MNNVYSVLIFNNASAIIGIFHWDIQNKDIVSIHPSI